MGETEQRIYLITGGSGSLGTALTRRLLSTGHKVRTYSRNEHSIEKLKNSVADLEERDNLSAIPGAVEDRTRLFRAMQGVNIVIHAAAQKIIPIAEYSPATTIQTNILGTMNVVECALDCDVKKAVLISTDKARGPSTLYGATKLCAERLWLSSNRYCGLRPKKFAAVAYGNVFGSQGSVIHSFMQQAQFGVVMVTHPHMTRFHLRLDQAVDLVLRVVEEGPLESLWIPRLPTYRMADLAEAFTELAGLTRRYQVIGRRVGEKIHEEMVSENESCTVAVKEDDHYILTPGQVQEAGGWNYSSDSEESKRKRISKEGLMEEIKRWKEHSS